MNVGEWGISFNFNQGFNISGFTTLSLKITRKDGSTIVRTNPQVSVGAVPLNTESDGTYIAGQYAIYVFAVGDLTVEGQYSARLEYTDGSKHLVSDIAYFTVNP